MTWARHEVWFQEALQDPKLFLLKIVILNQRVGYIRLHQFEDEKFDISIIVDPSKHGKGIANRALISLLGQKKFSGRFFRAVVHKNNVSSRKLFEGLGFLKINQEGDFAIMEKLN